MPGGPEWIIILVVLAIPVAIVLLVLRLGGSTTATPVVDSSTIRLPGDGRGWLNQVAGDIHQLNGHSVEWLSADVLQVSWRHRTGWVFVVAIIVFPIGLFALLSIITSHGTIVVVDDGSPSTMRLGGEFSNAAVDAVNARVP